MLKISIITVVLNREDFIEDLMKNIYDQTYKYFEHIIIDGKSSDRTVEIIEKFLDKRTILFSEPDKGIYNAINKGISKASGDIICLMHSDDLFAANNILEIIQRKFTEDKSINLIYGDLEYVYKNNTNKILRRWKAKEYSFNQLKYGWMIPHPTIFIRKEAADNIGEYNEHYHISSDYEYILRCLLNSKISTYYMSKVLVKMRVGGESNMSIMKIIKKTIEDYKIIRKSKIGGLVTVLFKNLRKVEQFFIK